MTPTGLEQVQQYGNSGDSPESGAKSGAVSTDSGSVDPDLAFVLSVWPTLPNVIREAILATISTVAGWPNNRL